MELILKVIILDGTPEEIRSALPELIGGGTIVPMRLEKAQSKPSEASADDEGRSAVTERVARKILSRRVLSAEMEKALKLIYKSGNEGILGTDLQTALRLSRPQFTGLMGAFGNRISNTQGYIEGDWFFDQEWDSDELTNRYKLPESVRAALVAEGIAS